LERWWRSSIPKSFIEHSISSVLVVIIKRICPTPKPPDVTILKREIINTPYPSSEALPLNGVAISKIKL